MKFLNQFSTPAVTPAQIASNQTAWNPGGNFVRLSADADGRSIISIAAGADGQTLRLRNAGPNFVVLLNESTSDATAANRIHFATAANLTLATNETADLIYDATFVRWTCVPYTPHPGTIISSASSSALPQGYLPCTGAAVSRTNYPGLMQALTFTQTGNLTSGSPVINFGDTSIFFVGMPVEATNIPAGTKILSIVANTSITLDHNATATATGSVITFLPWGAGDSSTTFNVPDTRGRAPIASGTGTLLTARLVGYLIGEETHTLTTAEMPSHQHNYNQFGASSSALVGSGSGFNTNAASLTTATGGGGAHNNMQPSAVVAHWVRI